MIRTKIVGTHNNGDIEYKVLKDIDYFIKGLSWCIAFLLACLFCFFVQKWVVLPFLNILSCIFLLCTVVLFGYLYRRSSRLEKEEASLVTDAIHFIAEQDAIQRNLEIVDTKFCSDTLDSYGTIDEEYVLVLLSDKTIIKYPIEHLSKEDKRYNYKLIKKDFLEDVNKTQTQKISRTTLQYRIMNSPALITLITWIIIIGILAIGAVVMSLFLLNIHDAYDAIALFSIPFWLLLFVPIDSYIDKKLPKNRVCNVIRFILSIPVFILKLSKLTTPFLTIMATFMLIFVYSFLPVFIIVMGVELLGYDTTFNTKLFVFLTFPFIIASQG